MQLFILLALLPYLVMCADLMGSDESISTSDPLTALLDARPIVAESSSDSEEVIPMEGAEREDDIQLGNSPFIGSLFFISCEPNRTHLVRLQQAFPCAGLAFEFIPLLFMFVGLIVSAAINNQTFFYIMAVVAFFIECYFRFTSPINLRR